MRDGAIRCKYTKHKPTKIVIQDTGLVKSKILENIVNKPVWVLMPLIIQNVVKIR